MRAQERAVAKVRI